jgi:hypothetical protein
VQVLWNAEASFSTPEFHLQVENPYHYVEIMHNKSEWGNDTIWFFGYEPLNFEKDGEFPGMDRIESVKYLPRDIPSHHNAMGYDD